MSPGLIKMFLALVAIALMFLANIFIMVARNRLKGIWKVLMTVLAVASLIISLVLVIIVVLSF
ncbi:DUF2768 family protein [Bacillus horti]|uniref:Glucan phosphoethanolaminetransferase (Alkaline phosphatase superfamily) n=1 Tax=Caldalkalibacillus horti TaxID=77523 RepID=A0ABT9W5L0_9BACI|nr:DUF2768 family protein [Bacillus horti]MDQ0168531.1 glucan phosphoethanolaminetransferase (alkaline phosphatase superfamily) [Bacillus horti]